jgi:arylsulfatase A-like enzyme
VSPLLRGRLATGVAFAIAVVAGASAADSGPDTVVVTRARLRGNSSSRSAEGSLDVTIRVHDRGSGGAFIDQLAAAAISMTLSDGGDFAVLAPLAPCTIVTSSAVTCATGDRRMRARFRLVAPSVWTGTISLRSLAPVETGVGRPRGPVRFTLAKTEGNSPSALGRECRTSGSQTIVCRNQLGPNIIVVVTDDQRWDSLPYLPNVQRLAAAGVSFTNAYVTTPLCAPSRASLLSGLYAHDHHVLTIDPPPGGASAFVGTDASTLATWLHDAGYRTGFFGKYLNDYAYQGPPYAARWYVPPGWDVWNAFVWEKYYDYSLVHEDGSTTSYGAAAADYSTDVLAAKVRDFIAASSAAREPFLAYFAPFAPHSAPYYPVPAPRYVDAAVPNPPYPPSYDEADVSDKPAAIAQLPPFTPDQNLYIGVLRGLTFQTLFAVDDAIGSLLSLLADQGQASRTAIVYVSDNGFAWGEHRLIGKECPYEECQRVPLIIATPSTSGRTDDRFALGVDLAPTVAELAGVLPPTSLDGASLAPLLGGAPGIAHDAVLLEEWMPDGSPQYVGIRTPAWKYVEYPTGETELYDEESDPFELANVAADPNLADVVIVLREQLATLAAPRAP